MNRIDLLKSMLAEDASDPFLHYALGLELAKTEYAAAAQQFAALSLSHPEYLATYYQWGQCLEAIGQLQDARNAYQKGLPWPNPKASVKPPPNFKKHCGAWKTLWRTESFVYRLEDVDSRGVRDQVLRLERLWGQCKPVRCCKADAVFHPHI